MRPITMQMAQFKADTQENTILRFENCKGGYFSNKEEYGLKVFGNSVQNRTPTPDNPIEIENVGDLVTDGEYAGKYKIEIKVVGGSEEKTATIYLDEPLRKIPSYWGSGSDFPPAYDYIDFAKKKVVRSVGCLSFKGDEYWVMTGKSFRYPTQTTSAKMNPSWLCNRFVFQTGQYNNADFVGITSWTSGGTDIMCNDGVSTTIDEWKAQLAAWNEEGNPLIVYGRLVTPTEEDIELPQLEFIKGDCNVFVQTDIQATLKATALVRR